jgi:hypothetical protein
MSDPSTGGVRQVAGNVVDALRAQPMTLGLIVLTAIFMWFIYSAVRSNREEMHTIQKMLIERCTSSNKSSLNIPVADKIALDLAHFTGPDGQSIEINPEEIVSIRAPGTIAEHLHRATRCIVTTSDGKFVGVREECSEVEQKLGVKKED